MENTMPDADSTINANASPSKEFLAAGVSRSGRVRKKSSKLLDFQSPDALEKKTRRVGRPPGSGRPRLLVTASLKGKRLMMDDDDESDEMTASDAFALELDEELSVTAHVSNSITTAPPDSEDELDELVADLVEGVEAESLEHGVNNNESKVRHSLYMIEKTNKRKILKDGKVITRRMERKDKGKSRCTAYSMWAREFRKSSKFSKNQDLDFSTAARRLGELWANVSNKEKSAWRRKAKIQSTKTRAREKMESSPSNTPSHGNTTPFNMSFLNRATTSRTKKLALERHKTPPPPLPPATQTTSLVRKGGVPIRNSLMTKRKRLNSQQRAPSVTRTPTNAMPVRANNTAPLPTQHSGIQRTSPATSSSHNHTSTHASSYKVSPPDIEPIDAAAHLKLLGESLTIIGERLKEHDGKIASGGSLSVLLDSLLCSMGPLMCLTKHIPGLEKKPQLKDNLVATLDNIAYVMPGL